MEYQFIKELSENCLLFKNQDGGEVIFDKVEFEVLPREGIRLEIQRELKKIIEPEKHRQSEGLLKYSSLEKYQGSLYLARDAKEGVISQFEPVDLREACQFLLMTLKVIKSFHQEGIVLGGVSFGQIKRSKDNRFFLQDPLVMNYLGKYLNRRYRIDSPVEVIRGKTWEEKSDVFSWGVLAFRILTGKDPFEAESPEERLDKIIRLGVANPKDLVPQLSDSLNNLVLRSLNQQSKKRPSIEELISELSAMLDQGNYEVSLDEAQKYKEKAKLSLKRYKTKERFWLWFRKYGFLTIGIIFVIIFICLIMQLSKSKPVITAQTKPAEVINYYFQGMLNLDIGLLEESARVSKNTFKDIITNLYVINRVQQATTHSFNDFVNVEINDLKIQNLSAGNTETKYRVDYSLKIDTQNETFYYERQDIFDLKQVHRIWRIINIDVIKEKKWSVKKSKIELGIQSLGPK